MSIIQGRYSLYQWLYPSFHQRGNHESHVKRADQKFEITDEGEVDEYIGVEIDKRDYGTVKMYLPLLIKQILDSLGLRKGPTVRAREQHPARYYTEMWGDLEMQTEWEYANIIISRKIHKTGYCLHWLSMRKILGESKDQPQHGSSAHQTVTYND